MNSPGLERPSTLPRLRVRPPQGWLNDPNGPVWWQGRWHLFFQYNPHAPVHDAICWGHASSDDLVHWHDEPVAFGPSAGGPDAFGCWSGCVVDDGGVAVAIYTGVAAGPETATICLARSAHPDLAMWEKAPAPVAGPPPGLDLLGFRDPFVFTHDGHRYAVVGAGGAGGGRGMVLLYGCDDLTDWTYLGVLVDHTDPVAAEVAAADVWECPSLVLVDGRWVLLVSLVKEPHLDRVVGLVGDLVTDGAGLRFVPEHGDLLDHGHAFYAPLVLPHEDRALLWGWIPEDRPASEVAAAGWSGALTLTREVYLDVRGHVATRPVRELENHGAEQSRAAVAAGSELPLPEGVLDLLVTVPGDAGEVTLTLLDARLTLDTVAGTACLAVPVQEEFRRAWPTSTRLSPGEQRVRLVLDASVLEVYVEGGPTYTERAYGAGPVVLGVLGSERVAVEVRVRSIPHLVDTSGADNY